MKESVKNIPILQFEYPGYPLPEDTGIVLQTGLKVPQRFIKEAEDFIKKHGFLTYVVHTEYSTKGYRYVTIYGEYL